MSNLVPSRCAAADLDSSNGKESLRQDILSLVRAVNAILQHPADYTSNWSCVVNDSGTASVYAMPSVTTTNAKHKIQVLRNGQAESVLDYNTSLAELTAYTRIYLGDIQVSAGDRIELNVLVDASVAPEISVADLTIQITIPSE